MMKHFTLIANKKAEKRISQFYIHLANQIYVVIFSFS